MDISLLIEKYGVLGLLAWLVVYVVSKIVPAMESMRGSVDGLKAAIEKETEKICKFSGEGVDRGKNGGKMSLSNSDKASPPLS
jgi:hypothetical protein